MSKTIVDYLKVDHPEATCYWEGNIGEYHIEIAFRKGKQLVLLCDGDEYDIDLTNPNYAIQDIMYDNYDTEIRFCDECGKPYDAGFMAGDGEYYCCEECFEPMMDRDYGKGKWRATEDEGYRGGFYEYLDGDEWEDTGIFYTEWN